MSQDIDGLVLGCSISIADTLEILHSCIKPSIISGEKKENRMQN